MNAHRLDLFSLVAGLATVAVAVVLIVPDLDIRTVWNFLPVLLVIAGLAMLVSSLRRGSTDPSTRTAPETGAHQDTGERPGTGEEPATGGEPVAGTGLPGADAHATDRDAERPDGDTTSDLRRTEDRPDR